MMRADDAMTAGWIAVMRAVETSRRAPLSARHALHAAVLIDQLSDLAFTGRTDLPLPLLATAGDILSFRAALRSSDPALGRLIDLTACGPDAPRLQVLAEAVAPDGFERLAVADLMVSLYNAGRVPRLMLVQPDETRLPMQDLLQQATSWWRATLGPQPAPASSSA